jgi:hypothetical protein
MGNEESKAEFDPDALAAVAVLFLFWDWRHLTSQCTASGGQSGASMVTV